MTLYLYSFIHIEVLIPSNMLILSVRLLYFSVLYDTHWAQNILMEIWLRIKTNLHLKSICVALWTILIWFSFCPHKTSIAKCGWTLNKLTWFVLVFIIYYNHRVKMKAVFFGYVWINMNNEHVLGLIWKSSILIDLWFKRRI